MPPAFLGSPRSPPVASPSGMPVSRAPRPVPPSAAPPSRSPWRSLRHRGMRWWSLANLVSNTGTWMQLTVQNLLVLQVTGSAAATGLSMSVQAAPALLAGVAGGAAVDRLPRRVTATVSQLLLGAVAFATALLVALDRIDMTALLVLAAVTGTIATVDAPACALLGNDLVPAADLPSAIGVGALVHSAGRLLGTALAGVTSASWAAAPPTPPTDCRSSSSPR